MSHPQIVAGFAVIFLDGTEAIIEGIEFSKALIHF